jgi:hypothetical protein
LGNDEIRMMNDDPEVFVVCNEYAEAGSPRVGCVLLIWISAHLLNDEFERRQKRGMKRCQFHEG